MGIGVPSILVNVKSWADAARANWADPNIINTVAVNVMRRRIFMALNWGFDLVFQGLISARLIKIMQAIQNVGPSHQDDQG